MNQGEALRIENLHFRYPGDSEDLIEGLNMQLGRGEILCIAGASGQGKSMLLRLIAGLEMPSDGAILFWRISPRLFAFGFGSRRAWRGIDFPECGLDFEPERSGQHLDAVILSSSGNGRRN